METRLFPKNAVRIVAVTALVLAGLSGASSAVSAGGAPNLSGTWTLTHITWSDGTGPSTDSITLSQTSPGVYTIYHASGSTTNVKISGSSFIFWQCSNPGTYSDSNRKACAGGYFEEPWQLDLSTNPYTATGTFQAYNQNGSKYPASGSFSAVGPATPTTPVALTVAISVAKPILAVGAQEDVTANITATGGDVTGISLGKGLVSSSDAALVSQSSSSLSDFDLSEGSTKSFAFTVKGEKEGTAELSLGAAGMGISGVVSDSDQVSLTVSLEKLIVNTTSDEGIDPNALSPKSRSPFCAIEGDADASDPKCSLRAAIQLVNKLGGTPTITFDIPGGGVPKIAPTSALPAVTAPDVTIDATSQPGGWVEINGAEAGKVNGLVLDGDAVRVRGLVVNGFAKGIGVFVAKGNGDVITGDRIGTDAAGEKAVPNDTGVEVTAGGATIGGVADTRPDTCAGDCDLISGNTYWDVRFGAGGSGKVIGDTIGPNITGDTVPAWQTGMPGSYIPPSLVSIGQYVDPSLASIGQYVEGKEPGSVTVGGATSAPGVAPGNVIAGGTLGIWFASPSGGVVAGNLIGLNRAGTRSLEGDIKPLLDYKATSDFPDVYPDDPYITTKYSGIVARDSVEIGGMSSADANVISGFPHGVSSGFDTPIEHDLIGTNAAGDAAIGNIIGVDSGKVVDSLVSGNLGTGIYNSELVTGSRIGTNAQGTGAVPNGGFGIAGGKDDGGTVGGVRAEGSESCTAPCNLISGNGLGAIDFAETVEGNFIGTDLSGTRSIPNGSFWQTIAGRQNASQLQYPADTALYRVVRLGGASQAAKGICDLACNLISGNDEGAVTAIGSNSVEGNVIGRSASNSPLPNEGLGISAVDGPGTIGGDGSDGNMIADNSGAAIVGHGTAPTIEGNSITGNADGIVYSKGVEASAALVTPTVTVGPGGQVTISGHIHVFHNKSNFISRIDVYGDTSCERGPQGMVPLGSVTAGILSGDWTFTVPDTASSLKYFTVTLTVDGSTSTFSSCGSAS